MESSSDVELRKRILATIQTNRGILFASPSLVGRHTYLGRDILAPNSKHENGDDRGYVPVEWWICSSVAAGNPILKDNEGIASFFIQRGSMLSNRMYDELDGESVRHACAKVLFTDILRVAESEILGSHSHAWPLIKVLDIGGAAVTPNFTSSSSSTVYDAPEEVPPIPAHVHSGYICDGRCCGHGKLEAYFFPPLAENHANVHAKTRLGIKPGTSPETLMRCMQCFGQDDSFYTHLNEFTVEPFTGWTIACGVVHAPGPYLTFEVQLPQDDGNLLAWQLGQQINDPLEREREKQRSMLRGASNERALFKQIVNMNLSADNEFKRKWFHPSRVIESNSSWGRRMQTFFGRFYGEAIEIIPGGLYRLEADERPFVLIVWQGTGSVNGHRVSDGRDGDEVSSGGSSSVPLSAQYSREMLVTPGTELVLENDSSHEARTDSDNRKPLLLLSVYPIAPAVEQRSGIACAGLSCVDYIIWGVPEMKSSTDHLTARSYEKRVGGSVPNTSRSLMWCSSLLRSTMSPKPEGTETETLRCEALTLLGKDEDSELILEELEKHGVGTRYVKRTAEASTQVAFLPVYGKTGDRACFVVPGATAFLDEDALLGEVGIGCRRSDMLRELLWLNLGYPHELNQLQGDNLAATLCTIHSKLGLAVAIDLNGSVSSACKTSAKMSGETPISIVEKALQYVCLVHVNYSEALSLSGLASEDAVPAELADDELLMKLADSMLGTSGAAIVTITLGKAGACVKLNSDIGVVRERFGAAVPSEEVLKSWSITGFAKAGPASLSSDSAVEDTVGAGDAFQAGMLVALERLASIPDSSDNPRHLMELLMFAQQSAARFVSKV